ncbi:hypothetical protein FQZ97_1093320 [compost metagenome]
MINRPVVDGGVRQRQASRGPPQFSILAENLVDTLQRQGAVCVVVPHKLIAGRQQELTELVGTICLICRKVSLDAVPGFPHATQAIRPGRRQPIHREIEVAGVVEKVLRIGRTVGLNGIIRVVAHEGTYSRDDGGRDGYE